MAATDAKPIPQKNVAYRVYFTILDDNGDPVAAAAGLDSERSLDGATFADCTNEATEIVGGTGQYFLDLTAAEMNTDCTVILVKSTTTDSKDTVIVLYPEEAGDIRVNLTQWLGVAPLALVSQRVATQVGAMAAGVIGSAAYATGAITATAIATGAITAAKFAAGAIDAAAFAQAAADKVWATAARILTAATNITSTGGTTVPQTGDSFARLGAPAGASVSADVAAVKVDTAAVLTDTADIQPKIGTPSVDLSADIATRATPAQVNTEVSDVLKTDTVTLPGQGAPSGAPTMEAILGWVYKAFRNKKEQTATEWRLYDDAGTTVDSKATVSDAAGTATKEEVVSGP